MRQYYQGTLDFACALYAVINALSLTCDLDLQRGRHIYQKSMEDIARYPTAWTSFMGNQTDHYWVVAFALKRWCTSFPYALQMEQPFSSSILPFATSSALGHNTLPMLPDSALYGVAADLDSIAPYCEEDCIAAQGQSAIRDAATHEMWRLLQQWFTPGCRRPRTALLRFHRFIPSVVRPVVSHWTTVRTCRNERLLLFDASAEPGSIHEIPLSDTLHKGGVAPFLALTPSSLILLEKA